MNHGAARTVALFGSVAPLLLMPVAASAGAEIAINANGLQPKILETTVEERVTFINRTARPVHLEFRQAPDRHDIFQVPGRIWATFHVPGRHPYVVHIEDEGSRVRALEGAVLVSADPNRGGGPPVCDGTTVAIENGEVCIER